MELIDSRVTACGDRLAQFFTSIQDVVRNLSFGNHRFIYLLKRISKADPFNTPQGAAPVITGADKGDIGFLEDLFSAAGLIIGPVTEGNPSFSRTSTSLRS